MSFNLLSRGDITFFIFVSSIIHYINQSLRMQSLLIEIDPCVLLLIQFKT